ncbi:MAG: UDP-N-acetylmuramoyl-tripeptide--D-alanyl-D-alanine ligase [Proteobacteria bacterium]|nr:MAG: UDP-N-acetylmuramoyl-tripeptide--D-alanyl-D-alanine ligase [Pseudomonadota bacterium]
MIQSCSFSRLAEITGGHLRGTDGHFQSISTDTRRMSQGDLFVALIGPNFNGNRFVGQARQNGACAALVSEYSDSPLPQIRVENTLVALRALAADNRNQFGGLIFAVTGSNGKTTVKEMLASIMAQSGSVFSTRGNLNNHFGVPISLLQISAGHEYAVIELGASAKGEILFNTQLVQPDVAIITNAGEAHLEGFGSKDVIVRTKGEILAKLGKSGVAVLNMDDPAFGVWSSLLTEAKLVSFSAKGNPRSSVYAQHIERDESGVRFDMHFQDQRVAVSLPLPGLHTVSNALAAAAAAWSRGVSPRIIQQGLQRFSGVASRLQFRQWGSVQIIDDSYNANPSSVCAAIEVLSQQPGYQVAVLGDMAELGPEAERLHASVGKAALEYGIDRLMATGQFASVLADSATGIGESFGSKAELIPALVSIVEKQPMTTILVKGSRGARMEEVINWLEQKTVQAAKRNTESNADNNMKKMDDNKC